MSSITAPSSIPAAGSAICPLDPPPSYPASSNHPVLSTHLTPKKNRFTARCRQEASEFRLALRDLVQYAKQLDYKALLKKSVSKRKYIFSWCLVFLGIALSILLSSYHHRITTFIQPYQQRIKNLPASWLIPTVLLIVVSFPPLMGHEILILLSGMIWGTWIGFAIASAGTFLGELATYVVFKKLIKNRAQQIESKSVSYATLVKLMREGGLTIVVLVRASALPGHIVTAIQASIGISFWIFTIACFVTLPKQFAIVYVGVLLSENQTAQQHSSLSPSHHTSLQEGAGGAGDEPQKEQSIHHTVSAFVFLLTAFFTLVSAYVVWMRMRKLRPSVEQEFREREIHRRLQEQQQEQPGQGGLHLATLGQMELKRFHHRHSTHHQNHHQRKAARKATTPSGLHAPIDHSVIVVDSTLPIPTRSRRINSDASSSSSASSSSLVTCSSGCRIKEKVGCEQIVLEPLPKT